VGVGGTGMKELFLDGIPSCDLVGAKKFFKNTVLMRMTIRRERSGRLVGVMKELKGTYLENLCAG
jgi:hypothetical protein